MQAAKREAAVRGDHSPLRVLLVEDNEIDAMVARAAVEKAVRGPLKIQCATTLQKSLVILGSGQVDLVLLDLNLPDSRGIDTLKSMGVATSCPIIVITAEERPGLDEEALGNGAFEILHKGRLGTDTIARLLRLAEERHRAQGSLERARSRLELALAASRVCIWDYDLASGDILLSESWSEIVGARPGETRTTSKVLAELVHPEDIEPLRHALIDVVKGLTTEYAIEHRVRYRTGAWRWIVSRGKVVERDARGRAVRMVGTHLDITERKRGEALLRGEKQVLEMIAKGAPLDESLAAMVRVLEAQAPGMLCSVLLLDPDGVHLRHGAAPSLPEDYTRAIDGLAIGASVGSCGTAAFRREPVIVEDVGTDPLWADYRELASRHGLRACWSTPIFDPQGGVLGTFAMYYREPGSPTAQNRWLIDFATQLAAIAITRWQAEAGVVEAKQRLENALESSEAAVWVTDLRTNEVWLSAGWAAYLGKPRADTRTTVAEMLTHIHPDDHRAIAATNAQVTKGEVSSYVVEYRVKSEDGWKWIASRGRVIERDADGHPLRSSGACANITPRKRAEEARDHARSRLELALAASRVCIWDYDLASGDVVLSESWAELIGAPPGETRTTIKALTELVHPDDFESLRRTQSDVAKGLCAEYTVEHRVCDRTGAWRWIVSRGKVIERDARGRALRVVGTNLDIGERKRAEQLLTLEHAVTHSLSESRDTAGAVRGAIQAICESEHWECCRYLWVDAAAGLLRAGEAWSVPDANIERYVEDSRAMVYAPGVGLVGKVWQSQEPLWVPDIANDPRVARPGLAQATGMRASLVVPVAAESRIIGVLIFHSRQVREPDPALLLKIRLIGGHIGQFVQRAQAEQAVRESEARFRSLTELSSDWYWEQDENFRFVAFSETPGSNGALRSAMIGKARWENSSILLSQEQWAAHRAVLEAHQPFRHFEYPFMHPDGDTTWSSISGEPVFGAEGRFKGYRGVGRDITERVRAEDDLRRFRLAMDNSADMIVLVDRATMRFVDVNSTVCRLLGYTREELLAKRPEELLPVSRAELEAAYDRQIADPSVLGGMTSYYRCRDGSRLPFESKRQVLRSGDKWLISVVSRDIRERIQADSALRESEQRFRGLTELSSDWYWEQDAELRFTYLSPRFSERTEGDPAKVLGRRRWEFDNVVPASDTWPEHRAVLEAHQPFRDFEQIRVRDDGTRQFFSSSGEPVFDAAGNFNGYRGVSSNITVRRSAEKRLVYLAQFDAVTGLPNRNLLEEKLGHAIVQSRRRGRGAGVLFIDLDRFKLVNDTLGHRAGDALLSQVGRSLRDCVRLDDTVGRLAGDEFAVVIADLARPEDAAFVAQKIVDSFAAPFDLDGQEIFLTASIGISTFPGDGDDGDTLLRCADAAMYRAKESSRNSFCFYTAEMNARTAAKLQLNNDLRRAVERKEFRLYYQPKVNLASGALTGMEALLRWQHPERGMVSPLDFIPALEDTGLIVAVGDWVVEEACRQLRDWTRDGLQPVPIAVNLSARQFRRRDLDAVIRGIVAAHGLQAGLLELEITESSLMADPKDAIRQLHALRAAGLRISVDDFGTGYSSLSYLTRLPLSTLKIDRSFVNAAITDPNSAAIVRMVIDMAQNLRFDVVAEGIETEAHVAFLRQHGCEQGQGYHFGRPAPADEVAVRLSRRA